MSWREVARRDVELGMRVVDRLIAVPFIPCRRSHGLPLCHPSTHGHSSTRRTDHGCVHHQTRLLTHALASPGLASSLGESHSESFLRSAPLFHNRIAISQPHRLHAHGKRTIAREHHKRVLCRVSCAMISQNQNPSRSSVALAGYSQIHQHSRPVTCPYPADVDLVLVAVLCDVSVSIHA